MVYDQLKTDLATAIGVVGAALATGEVTVEYEIRGRRHKVKPSDEVLDNLEKLYSRACRKSSSAGRFSLAKPRRASSTG